MEEKYQAHAPGPGTSSCASCAELQHLAGVNRRIPDNAAPDVVNLFGVNAESRGDRARSDLRAEDARVSARLPARGYQG